jgi:hypothetical protein
MSVRSKLRNAIFVVALGLVVLATSACAQQEQIQFSSELTSVERVLYQVGPDTEKTYGWNRFTGTTTIAGQPAEIEFLGNVDYKSGNGPFYGFITVIATDGSQLALRVDGEAKLNTSTNDTRFDAKLEVIGGTGKWVKSSGKGEFTGNRRGALGSPVEMSVGLEVKE